MVVARIQSKIINDLGRNVSFPSPSHDIHLKQTAIIVQNRKHSCLRDLGCPAFIHTMRPSFGYETDGKKHNLLNCFSFWVLLLNCIIIAPAMVPLTLVQTIAKSLPDSVWMSPPKICSRYPETRQEMHPWIHPEILIHLAINSCEACLASSPLNPSCSQLGHAFTRLSNLSDSGMMTCLPLAENIGSTMLSATTPGVRRGP